MMYTFQPIIDQYWDSHLGLYIIMGISFAIMLVVLPLWREREIETSSLVIWACLLTVLNSVAYTNSFRPQVVYENARVIGRFVKFQPEGYNERSGKSRADHHYLYVVYEVEGRYAIMRADAGLTYPKEAVLYRNKTVDK